MGESQDGYGGNFIMSNDSQSFEFYDEEFGPQRISLSPKYNHQEGNANANAGSSAAAASPLGLRLRKTDSFLSMLEMNLSKAQGKVDDSGCQEKLKASNFPASFIKIGTWQRWTRHEGDLTAKLYYAKQKLVWEFLDGALKSKMEVQWSDIIAIKATTPDNDLGALDIEVKHPPSFFRETNPQPRKHTLWQPAPDFTGGQAPMCRRHHVLFPPGILDKHYQKLLQCDKRLLALSQKPFPSLESPYFDPNMFGIEQLSRRFNGGYSHPPPPPPPPPLQYPHHYYPNPAMNNDGGISNQILTQPPIHSWNQNQNQGPSWHLVHRFPEETQNPGLIVNHDYGFSGSEPQHVNNNNSWAPPQDHFNSSFTSFFFGDSTSGDDVFHF